MLFNRQAEKYVSWIQTRRRSPVRQATVRIYQSYLDRHILPILGRTPLEEIENGRMKEFIAKIAGKDLAPSTVCQIFNLVTSVISSYTDQNGNEIYPRTWNHDFIDLPVINRQDADVPIVSPEQVTAAISSQSGASRQMQAMLVLLAASGARIGEILALQAYKKAFKPGQIVDYDDLVEVKPMIYHYKQSFWDPETSILHINSTLVKGKVQPQPKTDAGNREIDLHPDINAFLKTAELPQMGFLFQNNLGDRARIETLYDRLEDLGLDTGFHAFRRFRATHLESQNVPRSLTSYWLGHAGNSITDRYIKIGQDLPARKEWAEKAGYGFQLP